MHPTSNDAAKPAHQGGIEMKVTRRVFTSGLAAGLAAPALLRGASAQGATVKVGQVVPITGPAAEAGKYAMAGAKLALEKVNKAGGVLGKPMEIVTEDDQTTNPGAVLAFSKLATNADIVGFIGSIRSTQMHAMAPDILKTAKPTMFGGTDPTLTKLGNPWLFRCRPNDGYSGRVIAEFGVKELKLQKWGIVHSTDAFGTNGMKALEGALKALNLTPVVIQGYANQSQDFTPVVLALKQAGVDIISSYFTFENDLGIFARQLRQLGVTAPWVGSPSIVNVTALKLAGPALYNTYGVADYAEDSSPEAKAFADAYRAAMKVNPDNQSSWCYDAVTLLAAAINKAGKTDPAAVRDAMLSIKGHKGAEGEYNFDQNGDGLHGYNVVQNKSGNIVFAKHIEFND
jgi:branched-chain amino acid transport system substrate-binding protein